MKARNTGPHLAISFTAIIVACVLCSVVVMNSHADPVLTGDTSRPESSTFAFGEPVTLTFNVTGLQANESESLHVNVQDEQGNQIVAPPPFAVVGDSNGSWQTTWSAPSSKLGFYRVLAQLSDGTKISGLGSRPDGYLTYCLVPDPSLRETPSEATARFGMQGGFNKDVNILPYLGIRWVTEDYHWNELEKLYPGQFETNLSAARAKGKRYPAPGESTDFVTYNGKPWQIYTLALLNKVPEWAEDMNTNGNPKNLPASSGVGAIAASARAGWTSFVTEAAQAYAANYPKESKRYYQLTWEPEFSYSFSGSHQDIVNIYAWAYSAIHAADPNAVIVGPAHNAIWTSAIKWHQLLLDLGLNNYIDGVSIHPYFTAVPGPNFPASIMPEDIGADGSYIENIRTLQGMFPGKPFVGTEQGFNTGAFSDPTGGEDNELAQAESLIRENLILLGEGYLFNMAFYITDVPGKNNDYGYYYNLVAGEKIAPDKMCPKPVAPAYAASSFLLDGSTTLGRVPNLAANEYGYAFQKGGKIILALWNNAATTQRVTLRVGVSSLQKYDWMGNESKLSSNNGSIALTLGPEPIYISGAGKSVLQGP